MSKWMAVAAALVLAAACTRRPADELTIDFSRDDDQIIVTAESALDSTAARDAAIAGVDPWAVRLARVNAEFERTTFEKTRGTLDRVVHTIRIPRRDLQQIFADTSITVHLTSADSFGELTFFPGTSTRASREQQEHFNEALTRWSAAAARYYDAVHRLYSYMDANPDRVYALYEAILAPPDVLLPALFEEEQPYVDQLLRTMDELAERMDQEERDALLYAEAADLIFNPFPARVTVNVPGDVKPLVIEPIDLFEKLKTLEGRWISPDPLLAFMREETVTPDGLARMPRRSTFGVRASDIEAAVREQFSRPDTYSIRWRE
jgi:hypothetical protein